MDNENTPEFKITAYQYVDDADLIEEDANDALALSLESLAVELGYLEPHDDTRALFPSVWDELVTKLPL